MVLLVTLKVLGIFVGGVVGADSSNPNNNHLSLPTHRSIRTSTSTSVVPTTTTTSSNILLPAFASSKNNNKRKNKKKKNNSNVVGAGFGQSSQPKLEDINFPTRIPPNAAEEPCPCGSTSDSTSDSSSRLLYKDCCRPFHNKEKVPQSPIDVLKSRYSAFSWRMIPYILDTTHPISRDFKKDKIKWAKDLNRDGMFDSYDFMGLDIIEEQVMDDDDGDGDGDGDVGDDGEEGDGTGTTNTIIEGFVEFKVNLRANKNSEHHIVGQEIVVSERSRFLRSSREGGWLYAGGDVKSSVGGEDIKLN